MATPVVWTSGAPTSEGGGGDDLAGWTVPGAADFSLITESSPGIATIVGDNDGTALPGASMTVGSGPPNLACAVLALPAPLADGEAIYADFDYAAIQYSFGACVVGLTAVKETSPGVWDGGNIQVYASHVSDQFSSGSVQWTATANSGASHTGVFSYTVVGRPPRFFRFRRDGTALVPEFSVDGALWIPGFDTQPLDPAVTHLGIWLYNNATSFTAVRLRAWKVE